MSNHLSAIEQSVRHRNLSVWLQMCAQARADAEVREIYFSMAATYEQIAEIFEVKHSRESARELASPALAAE